MLKRESDPDKKKLPKMTARQRKKYEQAVAEEHASKDENISAAREIAKRLKLERDSIAELVAKLREARMQAGISLNELEQRTGIRKSALSRLENSRAPNPTMLTLNRYAMALELTIEMRVVEGSS